MAQQSPTLSLRPSRTGVLGMGKKKRRKKALGSVDRIVGENIKKFRLNAGLSQESLGQKTGLLQEQISNYERAIDPVQVSFLYRISEALGVPTCRFFGQDHYDF